MVYKFIADFSVLDLNNLKKSILIIIIIEKKNKKTIKYK